MSKLWDYLETRRKVIDKVVASVLTKIDQKKGESTYVDFVNNRPVRIDFSWVGPIELEEGQISIQEMSSTLLNALREERVKASEVVEVCRRLLDHFRTDKMYNNPNTGGDSKNNCELATDMLDGVQYQYFDELARNEIEGLDLPDALIFARGRANKPKHFFANDTHFRVVQELVNELAWEIEIEKERISLKEALKINAAEPKPDEADAPNKFTRKQAMALLQALIPEFKEADNTKKAEFLVSLSPYNGQEKIAQEFSYLRTAEYADLVDAWRDKFRRTGRGRGKETT